MLQLVDRSPDKVPDCAREPIVPQYLALVVQNPSKVFLQPYIIVPAYASFLHA